MASVLQKHVGSSVFQQLIVFMSVIGTFLVRLMFLLSCLKVSLQQIFLFENFKDLKTSHFFYLKMFLFHSVVFYFAIVSSKKQDFFVVTFVLLLVMIIIVI